MLLRGASGRAYNMGSDIAVSIGELAHLIADCFPRPVEVQIKGTPKPGQIDEWYVPSVERAKSELGLGGQRRSAGRDSADDRLVQGAVGHRLTLFS